MLITASIVADRTGAPLYTLAGLEDLTEQERLEQELQEARAEEAGRNESPTLGGNLYGLTLRELTVLHKVATGKADKEIAQQSLGSARIRRRSTSPTSWPR